MPCAAARAEAYRIRGGRPQKPHVGSASTKPSSAAKRRRGERLLHRHHEVIDEGRRRIDSSPKIRRRPAHEGRVDERRQTICALALGPTPALPVRVFSSKTMPVAAARTSAVPDQRYRTPLELDVTVADANRCFSTAKSWRLEACPRR